MRVNIVIRTFNEGKYLPLCLALLKRQTYQKFQITIVDSGSVDLTLFTAQNANCNIIHLQKYNPGNAINEGIAKFADTCEYSVILSAHCLPVDDDWLQNFVNFMNENSEVAGAYGRQLPMNYTNMDDTRDLAAVLRGDTGIRTDNFFHNANSIVRNSDWQTCKFTEEFNHIEDVIWAQQIVKFNKKIGYVREAAVTHYHGLNQHQAKESFRARGLVNIFKQQNLTKFVHLRDLFHTSEIKLCIICFEDCNITTSDDRIILSLKDLRVTSNNDSISDIIRKVNYYIADNYTNIIATSFVRKLDDETLAIVDKCMTKFLDFFPDAVIPAIRDFGNYWVYDGKNATPIQDSLGYASSKQTIVKEELLMGGVISLNALSSPNSVTIENKILEFIDNDS